MRTIFEYSEQSASYLPFCDVPELELEGSAARKLPLSLPNVSETTLCRHYSALARRTYGVNSGFYPLGSCTMKYNPKLGEAMAALPGFTGIHPLAPEDDVQGCLEVLYRMQELLCAITGMDGVSLQPAAGAHGEFAGLLLIKAYHASRGDGARTKIIVPDSAHGTNPASAAMAGYDVVNIPSTPDGLVDLDALAAAVGPDTAGFMLTNPNTLGIFDRNILKITEIVHAAGGLCYYDGANMNAIMGIARPGDMGFDVLHLNLHKTFATPHGGGGPGSGPVGCKAFLKTFLPAGTVCRTPEGFRFADGGPLSIGRVKSFYGNFLVVVKALAYILTLGGEGLREASETAVLNANYLLARLKGAYEAPAGERCMHEFVLSLESLKKRNGVSALDVAKAMQDRRLHPPTMYFPLIVHEALMFEPTETESKKTLDYVADVMLELAELAEHSPQELLSAPKTTPVGRPDQVLAARRPVLKFTPETQG